MEKKINCTFCEKKYLESDMWMSGGGCMTCPECQNDIKHKELHTTITKILAFQNSINQKQFQMNDILIAMGVVSMLLSITAIILEVW